MILIPDYVQSVIDILHSHQRYAYAVGGCVRDALLNRIVSDFDITTSATPSEVIEILSPMKIIETGIKHGTVTVVTNEGNIEVTTFRTDGEYEDNRHPKGVFFTDKLEEDLSRRDFTMNALCYNNKEGVIDLFGGIKDIKNKTIRAVGNPEKRFEEDALRILRAVRFASVLGFTLESETSLASIKMQNLLKKISRERIFEELSRLICGDFADEVLCKYRSIIFVALDLTDKGEVILNLSDAPNLLDIRFALLLNGFDNPDGILSALKCSNEFKKSVCTLIKNRDYTPKDKPEFISFVGEMGLPQAEKLLLFKKACGEEFESYEAHLNIIKKDKPCLCISELSINGNDIIKQTHLRGKEVGDALERLFVLVSEGKIKNERRELLDALIE